MPKNIVFCADGTWDSSGNNTNVCRLFNAIPTTADQFPFYDDGVGSDGILIQKLAGGAFGLGLFQKIKDGYTKIAHLYEEGDKIFIFGFSRGAYTARSLAGMIAASGLPTKNFDQQLVESAFSAYRNKDQRQQILAGLNEKYGMFDAKITMVGVWDTVGSLGIPALFGGVSPVEYGFLDTGLHPDVLNAYQALAIDERRFAFPPTLWNPNPANAATQVVEQVWFTGVHCDVGGSYPETGLADITLSWMMNKAVALGLQVTTTAADLYGGLPDAKNALDQKHESWNIVWGFPRKRDIATTASISNSVSVRCAHDSSYRPGNLSITDGVLAGSYQMVRTITDPPAESMASAAAGGK
jgi:uncharacterized protein (DUF2235 family)